MLLSEFIRCASARLEAVYPAVEARAVAVRLCEGLLGTRSYTHIVEPGHAVPQVLVPVLEERLSRLLDGEPLQYVLGAAEFCGLRFRVTPDVLIPRPETEELCRLALSAICGKPRPRAMDLCTGSGCIAWTLALSAPEARVVGVDVSRKALEVAASQDFSALVGERGAKAPRFVQYDILAGPDGFEDGEYDLVVSNPPYVMEGEKASMGPNVVGHEPSLALFVPDDDPMLFCRAIALFASRRLVPGGVGLVEINEATGEAAAAVFSGHGMSDVCIREDFRGKIRFVGFRKPL